MNAVVQEESLAARIAELSWPHLAAQLDESGYGLVPKLLNGEQCKSTATLYAQPRAFRSRIVMARHGYGRGEYQYFDYPLPPRIATLRGALYAHLAPIANVWQAALRREMQFPAQHEQYLAQCHAAGQLRPTPLLLRYAAGDYNRLHQDVYGEQVFPLQVAILLSRPGNDFTGGEFVLTE